MVPKGCIITPSDKNLGVSILPLEWYRREYAVQIEKGAYIKVNKTEEQCIHMLLEKTTQFIENCSSYQKSLIDEYAPRRSNETPRLGILKLTPKVIKALLTFKKLHYHFKYILFSGP